MVTADRQDTRGQVSDSSSETLPSIHVWKNRHIHSRVPFPYIFILEKGTRITAKGTSLSAQLQLKNSRGTYFYDIKFMLACTFQ